MPTNRRREREEEHAKARRKVIVKAQRLGLKITYPESKNELPILWVKVRGVWRKYEL